VTSASFLFGISVRLSLHLGLKELRFRQISQEKPESQFFFFHAGTMPTLKKEKSEHLRNSLKKMDRTFFTFSILVFYIENSLIWEKNSFSFESFIKQ